MNENENTKTSFPASNLIIQWTLKTHTNSVPFSIALTREEGITQQTCASVQMPALAASKEIQPPKRAEQRHDHSLPHVCGWIDAFGGKYSFHTGRVEVEVDAADGLVGLGAIPISVTIVGALAMSIRSV